VSEEVVSRATGDCALTISLHSVTSDFQYNLESCHLQRYSNASAVVGCIRDGLKAEYRELVNHFVAWCENNPLILNINKTREIIV